MLGYIPGTRGRHPPAQCILGYGQQAGGTHPTGMHSCATYLDNDESWITVCNCGSGATGGGTDCCGGGDTC